MSGPRAAPGPQAAAPDPAGRADPADRANPADPPLLALHGLRVTLAGADGPVEVLRGVDLRLERGQTLGLIGESGCGKSMTALAAIGLLPEGAVASGSLRLSGRELLGLPEAPWCALRGDRIGMVFQEPMTALNPLHTVGRQVAESLRLHRGLGAAAARAEALRLLDKVQLPRARERLDAWPHQLSGGQRQRVVIAIALACGPDLLLADEPTTALDVTVQREVLDLLAALVRDDGMALLLISHDLAVIAERVQRLAVMYAGRVVEHGPAQQVLQRPAHPYTRGLRAARPRLFQPRDVPLPTIPGRVPAPGALPPGCAFADRCAWVQPACRAVDPVLRAVRGDAAHAAACLRADEVVAA